MKVIYILFSRRLEFAKIVQNWPVKFPDKNYAVINKFLTQCEV